MVRNSIDQLGSLQAAIMEIVWEAGEITVPDAHEKIARQQRRTLAYTTVLSAMQKLEKAGWLRRRREGRTHVYRAAASREDEGKRSLRKFTKQVFASDPVQLFEHLIEDRRITPDDLEALTAMIRKRKKELFDD